jgi:peptidoglycan-N-acetylglucosamine deacetylase
MNFRFPDLIRPFLGKLIWRKSPSEKVIYLTFDDGPVPEVTPLVLDILDLYKIKATFFNVGENVQQYPDLFADILRRGHKTGNHTFNHLKGVSVSTSQYVRNIELAAIYFDNKLFRPPYGRITFWQKRVLKSNFEIIMWDVLTRDYNRKLSPDTILKNIKQSSRNGSIVVFHDSIKAKDNVLSVLPLAIEFWRNEGYGFGIL